MGNRHTEFLALDHIAQVRAEASRSAQVVRKDGPSPRSIGRRLSTGLERLPALVRRRRVATSPQVAISTVSGEG